MFCQIRWRREWPSAVRARRARKRAQESWSCRAEREVRELRVPHLAGASSVNIFAFPVQEAKQMPPGTSSIPAGEAAVPWKWFKKCVFLRIIFAKKVEAVGWKRLPFSFFPLISRGCDRRGWLGPPFVTVSRR